MDIRTLLPANHVLAPFESEPGFEAVCRRLTGPLVQSGIVPDLEQFLQDLRRREDQITTQTEYGVAFPHARSVSVRRLGLVVGLSVPPGIVYGLHSERPVQVFFLIAVPAFAPAAHLPLLQFLAGFSVDQECRERLLSCTTPARAVSHLLRFQNRNTG
jgi:mannitol/fructose-specific phosphotransferase system IIA component (Ntr-type)